MKTAIYSGTFDPITNGHMDIITQALNIFDKLIIAVASSKSKKPMFDTNKRIKLINLATSSLSNIEIVSFDNLLVDFASSKRVTTIVRGLRGVSDFEFEQQMQYANRSLNKDINTIYLMPQIENSYISSSIVREILNFNGKISHLIPKEILKEIN